MEPEKKSNGALVGLVIIVIILIIGGVYMWQVKEKNAGQSTTLGQEYGTPEDAATLNAVDKDLGSIDTNVGVDAKSLQ